MLHREHTPLRDRAAKQRAIDIAAALPVAIGEKQKIGVLVEQYSWQIWCYCRENRYSLNSDVAIGIINDTIALAVTTATSRCIVLSKEIAHRKKDATALRKTVKDLTHELASVKKELELARSGTDGNLSVA